MTPATKSFAQVDNTPPTLNSLNISTESAALGDKVIVTANVTDDLSGVNYVNIGIMAGGRGKDVTLSYNSSTGKFEGSFIIGQYDPPGTWVIEFITIADNQQNYFYYYNSHVYSWNPCSSNNCEMKDMSQYNLVVTGTTLDTTAPTLNSLDISPNNAKAGDTVLISATITDDQSGVGWVTVAIEPPSGRDKHVTLTYNPGTGKYEGSYNIGQYGEAGTWKLANIDMGDNRQNEFTYYNTDVYKWAPEKDQYFERKDMSEYNFIVTGTTSDVRAPQLNSLDVSPKSAKVGDTVLVSANVTDNLSGVNSVGVDFISSNGMAEHIDLSYHSSTGKYEGRISIGQYNAPGIWKLAKVSLIDNQQNAFTYYNTVVYNRGPAYGYFYQFTDMSEYNFNVVSDDIKPETNITLDSSAPKNGDWYNSNVTATLNATDDNSGVSETLYRMNDGQWSKYQSPISLIDDGTFTINYKSIDKTGNEEDMKNAVINIDKTSPVTTASPVSDNWTNSDVTVTLSAIDALSGVARTEYRVNNGDWQEYSGPITVSQEGKNKVDYRSIDNAGNIETMKSLSVKVDKMVPTTSITPVKAGWYNSEITLNLQSSDELSGVANTEYKVNGGDWQDYTGSIGIINEGINTIQYRSTDNAGNIEEAKSVELKIDKTAPTLNVSFDQAILKDKNHQLVPITASVSANDNLSDVASVQLVSIVSNQADNDTGDGNTTQDIQGAEFGTPDFDFLVRAERSGSGDRSYTVTYKAVDNAGNSIISKQNIVVKHDNSKN
ncbi:hypothetical protein V7266_07010 [Neobacillus drentensis]|uniref:OmpL47-type beta-barrel domain-containing protein n=1 Tax=Neobacillus drentensis TaxID=220684 RepID=UPI002FFECC67